MKFLTSLLCLLLTIAQIGAQDNKTKSGEKRLALVIGNNDYIEFNKLKNSVKNANAMKNVLEDCGFEVMTLENGTKKSIKEKVREFSEKLESYDVGMFYYSGQGLEINGRNYIVPVDNKRAKEIDYEYQCIPADYILAKMHQRDSASKTCIMVLDACMEEPINLWSNLGTLKWTAPMSIPSGSYISYAASVCGKDIEAKELSSFTEILLKHIKSPGLRIEDVFMRVRIEQHEINKQSTILSSEPTELNKLDEEFFFVPVKNDSMLPEQNDKLVINFNGKNIEFYPEDLGLMNWQDAEKACEKLGSGWRLPDWPEMERIKTLFHDKGKGNFKSEFYINSSMQDNKVIPYLYNMKTGAFAQWGFNKEYSQKRAFVRPVRNI